MHELSEVIEVKNNLGSNMLYKRPGNTTNYVLNVAKEKAVKI
jgi:hypothetical protein